MVKRQKEKQYQSAREHKAYSQVRSGKVGSNAHNIGSVQSRLPYECCALTLVPFKNPVCMTNGILFENESLLAFLLEHKKDPIKGDPSGIKDIIKLHMDKDDEGRWQCPILTKPFHGHTKIVAIRDREERSAYVYSHEAYRELNVQSKNWTDLTTGKPFHPKKDVLILNNPNDETFQKLRDVSTFWHTKNARGLKAKADATESKVRHSVTASRVMDKIKKDKASKEEEERKAKRKKNDDDQSSSSKKIKIFSDDVTGVKFTSGKTSGSFTSTSMELQVNDGAREATEEEILQARFKVMRANKNKGYVQLHTNVGAILLELHCEIVPRTCTNFLGLCAKQKYDGTSFHRLIPNFMIQGGKAKEGEKDESIWGKAFEDEFDDRLKHSGGGVLSMANSGPKTNQRQFFISFKSCPHLDRKHSVFGKVVKGMDVLKAMEHKPVSKKDKPLEPIIIERTEILTDPAQEAEASEQIRLEKLSKIRAEETDRKKSGALGKWNKSAVSTAKSAKQAVKSQVGKYLSAAQPKAEEETTNDDTDILPAIKVKPPKTVPAKTKFGNFSGW